MEKGLEELEIKRNDREHRNYHILKIGQNTEKSPELMRKIVVMECFTISAIIYSRDNNVKSFNKGINIKQAFEYNEMIHNSEDRIKP